MIGPKWHAPEFNGVTKWLNSEPLRIQDLRGKVVLIDFWTYTCVNCRRTLPHIQRWHERYAKKGLVVIGVHSPEFDFEKKAENVESAVKGLKLTYPIAIDSDKSVWKAFNNRFWPARYLIDKDGYVTHMHFGEGAFDTSEAEILKALGIDEKIGKESVKTYMFDQSPETYAGFAKNMGGLGSGLVCDQDGCNVYIDPWEHQPNIIYPNGQWAQQKDCLELKKAPGVISYRFNAREAFAVIEPADPSKEALCEVFVDKKKIGEFKIDRPDIYPVFKDGKYATRELMLTFRGRVRFYAFTFG